MTFSATQADTITRDSLGHLFSLIGKKGRFIYAHKADDPTQATEGYNMLRHCGTLWFMLRAVAELRLDLPSPEARLLSAAIGYAAGKMDRPAWLADPSFALVTKGMVKTGGIGLSLLMLLAWRDLAASRPLPAPALPASLDDTIAGLVTYGLAQIAGDDVLHKRSFADGTPTAFRSDYYTGELLLGLIAASAPHDRVAPLTRALMDRDYGVDIQSHWMAYAACEAVERGYVDPAVGEAYLARLVAHIAEHPDYRLRRASTPIACRTEALTRILILAKRRGAACTLPHDTLLCAAREADTNLRLQLDWYRAGQFLKSDEDDKVQIDYIQHNATSYLNHLACL